MVLRFGLGLDTEKHAATFAKGRPGASPGSAYGCPPSDAHGQIYGFSYLSWLTTQGWSWSTVISNEIGRATYDSITDEEALGRLPELLSRLEGIIPALEPADAIALAQKVAAKMSPDKVLKSFALRS